MKLKITKTQGVVALVIFAVGGGIAYTARPKPILVDAAPVVRGNLETTIDADGQTRVRDRYVVTAPVAGRVARLVSVEGDVVRAGQVVARIAPLPLDSVALTQLRLRLESAEAVVLQAAAQARVATAERVQRRRDLSRAQRLFAVGAIAPSVFEESQLAALESEEAERAATERRRAAETDAAQTRAMLAGQIGGQAASVSVRAPANGRVLRIPERSERIVGAGAPLIEIGDPASLEVVIDVVSSDGALVHPGDRVRMSELAAGAAVEGASAALGRVREIEPAGFTKVSALGVEEQRVNVIIDPDQPLARIGDAFRVEASIVVWSASGVVRVPRSALMRHATGTDTAAAGWDAFVIRDGRADLRPVRVGHAGSADAEVLSGLAEGDRVVVFPSDQLTSGTKVKARKL